MTALRSTRRFIVAACSALAATAAAAAVATAPAATNNLAACPNGEENDTYAGTCVPYLVPNSPAGNSLCPPGVSGTECGSAEVQSGPTRPAVAPPGPEQELEDVSTPNF